MDKLQSLRLRAIALRSSVHNEHQLSAIELAGMCAKKTNEIIDVVNEFLGVLEEVEKLLNENGVIFVYDEETEQLTLKGV